MLSEIALKIPCLSSLTLRFVNTGGLSPMNHILRSILIAAILLWGGSVHASPLFLNGGFETCDGTGWSLLQAGNGQATFGTSTTASDGSVITATEGRCFATLQLDADEPAIGLSHILPMSPEPYWLSFEYQFWPDHLFGRAFVMLNLGADPDFIVLDTTNQWEEFRYLVPASSDPRQLILAISQTFVSASALGATTGSGIDSPNLAVIDNVRITSSNPSVPEPSSLAVVTIAFLACIFVLKQNNKL